MIPGTVRAAAGGLEVALDGGVALPLPAGARASDGQPVMFGIRPEHCAQGDRGGVPVDVVVVEPTGADTQLYCRFNGREITATIRDRTQCRPDDKIHLVPDLARAHLFDAASGARLAG
jgi:multiple sugar transport system ATP-binding protein